MEILLKISSKIKKPVSVFLIILISSIAFFSFAANNAEAEENIIWQTFYCEGGSWRYGFGLFWPSEEMTLEARRVCALEGFTYGRYYNKTGWRTGWGRSSRCHDSFFNRYNIFIPVPGPHAWQIQCGYIPDPRVPRVPRDPRDLIPIRELELDWPATPMGTTLKPNSTIVHLVQYVFEWAVSLGGLAGFIALIIAGFLYLTSVGDPNKMKEAKDRIVSVFLGLALLFGSYLILTIIDPELVELRPPVVIGPGREMPVFEVLPFPKVEECRSVTFCHRIGHTTYIDGRRIYHLGGGPCETIRNPGTIGRCGFLGPGITINSIKAEGSCEIRYFAKNDCGIVGDVELPSTHILTDGTINNIRERFRGKHAAYGVKVFSIK